MNLDIINSLSTGAQDPSGFMNPWMDLASSYAPRTIVSALELSEFLYVNDSTYKRASERIVSYFMTDLKFLGQADEERKKFEDFVNKDVDLVGGLQAAGNDLMCFSAEVLVTTKQGVFKLGDVAGQTLDVLSVGGVYRPAKFKSFGVQEIWELELADGEIIRTTAEHEWPTVTTNKKHKIEKTKDLNKNRFLFRQVAPRPEKNAEYWDGVINGIIYGDGSLYNKNRKSGPLSQLRILHPGKEQLLDFLPGFTSSVHCRGDYVAAYGGHPRYKSLPSNTASASYWYGFVCGFIATDGSVNNRGEVVLTQRCPIAMAKIAEQLPRVGMLAGKAGAQLGNGALPDGRVGPREWCSHLTIKKQTLSGEDFIRDDQREMFLKFYKKAKYGSMAQVHSVRPTGIFEEVFCCVEPETHTLVVGNGILTRNCYGNSFTTISMPFTRVLICGECKRETNIEHIKFHYSVTDGTFSTYCPKCKVDKRHYVKDYKKKDSKGIKMVRWNPKFITIKSNRLTHNTEYWTDIPHEVKSGVMSGDEFYIRTTPLPFLQAIKKQTQFKFKEGHIFHMKDQHLAGLWLGGWGLPSILSSFKNFFRLQVLRLYNERLMMDYIVPIRIISPAQGSYQDGNSIYNNMMNNWTNKMQDAVVRHRSDGTDWNFFPFPVNYQAVGGEGRELAPTELIKDEEDRMLNGRGIPPELYRSSMTLQAAPVALRVFERGWSGLVRGLNLLAQDSVDKISSYMGSGDYECELESVKIIDDLENKAWRLQAMSANLISKETAMGPMGIADPSEEHKKILEEQRVEDEQSKEVQEQVQMAQMGLINQQDPNGGGDQSGGGATPENLNQEADDMARKLLQMPDSERRRQLTSIRNSNDTLHALILKKMDQLRNQARSVGGEQALPGVVQNGQIPQAGGDPNQAQPETSGAQPQASTPQPPPQQ